MAEHLTEINIHSPTAYGSRLSNYSEAFEAWDEEGGEECRTCHGTGLDRDEVFDCPDCYGEGWVVPPEVAL